jgi:bile acid:Na+ symporter, BASS family
MLYLTDIDSLSLSFNSTTQYILKIILGLIIFGVALDLRMKDFMEVWKKPRPIILGLITQILLFPFFSFLIIWIGELSGKPFHPSVALGMLLVAACPGGNMSNFFTHIARGNTPLSVSMSAASTIIAAFSTPFNFSFWGSKTATTAPLMQSLALSFTDMFLDVTVMLALPMILGLIIANKFPLFAKKAEKPMRYISVGFFFALIILAFAANFNNFLTYIGAVALIVALQNAIALSSGYGIASLFGCNSRDKRTLAIEVGIQNSGLGLILCFQYFQDLGGMALICAWWGVWHIVSGLSLSMYWRKNPSKAIL